MLLLALFIVGNALRFDWDGDGESNCLCSLKGPATASYFRRNGKLHKICACNVAYLDHMNSGINKVLKKLTKVDFFRYFRADLWQKCVLFPDDAKCERKECAAENEESSALEQELASLDRSIDHSR